MTTATMEQAATASNGQARALRANCFIALPHYGALEPNALPAIMHASMRPDVAVNWRLNCASLLAHNNNRLTADFLNERHERGFTHFAMMHADQAPPPGWLDVLLDEMERVGADVISAAIAIKDTRGLVSTGERDPASGAIRRYTLTEIHSERFPETFSAADVCPGLELMVNTGLWLWRCSDAMDDFPGFSITDAIVTCTDGKKRAMVMPEDWAFSSWAHQRGLRVFATRKLKVVHYGGTGFANDRPWGEWQTDHGDLSPEQARISK